MTVYDLPSGNELLVERRFTFDGLLVGVSVMLLTALVGLLFTYSVAYQWLGDLSQQEMRDTLCDTYALLLKVWAKWNI